MTIDLSGQRFGRLMVLREGEQHRSPNGKAARTWVCRCDCGKEITVLQNKLRCKKPQKSCGCQQREAAAGNAKDLTGQRFGKLPAIKRVALPHPAKNGAQTGWLCRCDCGNEVTLETKDLSSGRKSCGCLLSETASEKSSGNVLADFCGTRISTLTSQKPRSNCKSGVRGVYFSEREGLWIAHLTVRSKTYKRRCPTMEEAIKARQELFAEYAEGIIAQYNSDKK